MRLSKQKIYILLAERCLTIGELAVMANLSRPSLTCHINGKKNPKPVTVGKIAKALNVPVQEIIEHTTAIVDDQSK